jgi:hypothetical protein
MEGADQTIGQTYFFVVIAAIIAIVVGIIAYILVSKRNTPPSGEYNEGFQGPARGVSDIPCGQESSYAIELSDLFAQKDSTTDEGVSDLKEFKQILTKLCCMKHDLMGPSQVVQSMMYIPYNNSHDRENPADTVARCFTKSIPPRDLDITFGTWKQRGLILIKRLCTSYNLAPSESESAKRSFSALWLDVFSIAKNACSPPSDDGSSSVSPRDVKGSIPESVEELGSYTGYY